MRGRVHGSLSPVGATAQELLEGPRLEPPREQRTWGWAWVAIGIAIALAAVVAAWGIQQARLDDARSSLEGTQALVVAQNRENAALRVRLDRVGEWGAARAARMHERTARLVARNADLRSGLADARALLGPPIADGRYAVELRMVGGNQSPPMIAFDRVRIFTGEEAVAAALADGVDPADVPDEPEYFSYVRNLDPTWQVVPVAVDARIVLQSWRFQKEGGYHPVEVTLNRFHRIYNGIAEWNHHLRWQRYSVQMADGEVVTIDEMNLSP